MPIFPVPTPIFHITAIDNLQAIALNGGLLAKNQISTRGLVSASIAYQQIQDRRAVKTVLIGQGGNLHDYVPFYFAPRSPMLRTIDSGNVPGCPYRQDEIVHLRSTIEATRHLGLSFLFTNENASLATAVFFDDLIALDQVAWPLLLETPRLDGYCKYWNSVHTNPRYVRRMEQRMAEFLVHQTVPLAAIVEIGVRTASGEARVRAALASTGWAPAIRVVGDWYY